MTARLEGRRLRLYVGVSLALHGAALFLTGPAREHAAEPVSVAGARLRVKLRSEQAPSDDRTPRVSLSRDAPPAPSSTPRPSASVSKRATRDGTPPSDTQFRLDESARVAPNVPPPDSGSGLDIEGMRQQARRMRSEHPGAPGGPAERTPHRTEPLDRPALEALARRIGQHAEGAREEVLADGSRRIRFSGGACLNVPRYLPLGRENAIGPTMLIPETCPRSGR